MKIKKNDNLLVIKGKDKGKQAKVERVLPKINKVILIGLNIYKKNLKPSKKNPHGGIIDINLPVSANNVMLVCPRCEKPTKVKYKISKDAKIRICKKCKEILDK